ncbi:uncharacterized protein LOC107620694 [Arachis ipaensis]|uniref:uncharacterized protein LOC107620694 n=1 Tax=Arachis ipaensis TaxID=130454 RepID=UPI0007AF0003|nr:uncharacterized protein LOC107620694 [Arachis ipaensis]
MAPRGCGCGQGRGQTSNEEPKTNRNNPVNFMAALENMVAAMQATVEALGRQVNNGNGVNGNQGPMSLATFLKVNPSIFRGTTNPTEVDNWFQLKRGAMSVAEYTNKFKELCQFSRICQSAPKDFEEQKCIKYEGGLQSNILSTVSLMEIRTFSELVNKSRVAEDYARKAMLEKGDHRGSFQRNQGRNFAPRGRNFKCGGFVPLQNQGQNNFKGPNNTGNQGRRFGKQQQNELSCQRYGKYYLGVLCRVGSRVCYFCGRPGHLVRNCLEKKKYEAGRIQQPEKVFPTSAASAEGSETLIRHNSEVASNVLNDLFDFGATHSFIAFEKVTELE